MTTEGRWFRTAMLAVAALGCGWLIPPVYHMLTNACPARPNGVSQAEAVPAFARKLRQNCSACHTAFPKLNAYGRQFKRNGYLSERGKTEGAMAVKAIDESKRPMLLEAPFPWGALAKSRPVDAANTRSTRFMPLHELELFIAGGNAAYKFSYFTEVEMESENQELEDSAGGEVTGTKPFTPTVAELVLGYHYNPYLNLYAGHRAFFMMDPWQTITGMGRQTANNRMMAMAGGASGQALGSEAQTLALYGEHRHQADGEEKAAAYYSIGMQADADDPQGSGPRDALGRVAFELPQYGLMVGAFGMTGSHIWQGTAGKSRPMYRVRRGGFDFLWEYENAFLQGAVAWLRDEDLSTEPRTRTTNRASYIEGGYAYKPEGRDYALIEPVLRLEEWQTNDHSRKYSAVTFQLAHFLSENVKVFGEYMSKLGRPRHEDAADLYAANPPAYTKKDNRWILQVEVGF